MSLAMPQPVPVMPKGARYRVCLPGDPAPGFRQTTTTRDSYSFESAAGRYLVLCFYATARDAGGQRMLDVVRQHRRLFDDQKISFFGVTFDRSDIADGRIQEVVPGIRHFVDVDGEVGRLYGALPVTSTSGSGVIARRLWFVIDPNMRIRHVLEASEGAEDAGIIAVLGALPPIDLYCGFEVQAPILIIPRVFEPELCERLIGLYEAEGGVDSGFMTEENGITVARTDHSHKRRSDLVLEDEALKSYLQARIHRRIVPEIAKVHQFHCTRMERYIVACYDAETGGHFRPHRDNTTKGTAHRRFAVSVVLNEGFEGGRVSFPEYGSRSYTAPAGGAVVFSCSLLHTVSTVTKGRRFVFLPFLYDDAAAAIREANNKYLAEDIGAYNPDAR